MPRVPRVLILSVVAAGLSVVALPAGAQTPDQAIADAGVITDTDIGQAGWFKGTQTDVRDESRATAAKIKSCKNYSKFVKTFAATTQAASQNYSSSRGEISNYSYVYPDEAAATKAFARASAPGQERCLAALATADVERQLENPEFRAQVKDYRIGVDPVPAVTDSIGDESVGYSGAGEITTTEGLQDRVIATTMVVRVGRAIMTYAHEFRPDSGAPEVFDRVLDNTVARSQAAQA